jgi:membrane associated rhomboid family serine protease
VAGFIHVLFYSDSGDPVVGASGAVSGVFGAVLTALWQAGRMPSLLPVAGIWIALNVFFGIFGGTPGSGGEPVAWTAHIGGFVYGLVALRLFVPAAFAAPSQPPPADGTD